MGRSFAGAFFGGLASGGLAQYRANQDNDLRVAADKRAQEEHDARMQEVSQKQDLERGLKTAALPQEVQQGAGGVTLPVTADNRDVGQPDGPSIDNGGLKAGYRVGSQAYDTEAGANTAAAAYNTPDAVRSRQTAVYAAAGKPMEAQQLETAGLQGKTAKLQLEQHEHDFINQKLDERLAQVGNPQELADHASTITGRPVQVVQSEDGKKAQLVYTNDKGEQVKYGAEFDNNAEGVSRFATSLSKSMKFSERVTALQHLRDHDEKVRQDEWTRKHGDATLENQIRHEGVTENQGQQQIGLHQQGLALQGQQVALHGRSVDLEERRLDENLKNDPTRNLPEGTRRQVLSHEKTIERIDTAAAHAMATPGGWDPKDPGTKELMAQRRAAQIERDRLLAPYNGGAAAGVADKPTYDQVVGKGAAAPGTAIIAASGAKPSPGAASGRVTNAAQQTAPAPVAAPAAARAPAPPPTLAQVLNPSGNPSLAAVLAPRAQALETAAAAVKEAQAGVVAAANGQDPAAVQAAVQRTAAAGAALRNSMAGMPEDVQQRITTAVGL